MKILFITTWYPNKENQATGVFVREYAKAVSLSNEVIVLHSSATILNLKGLYRIEKENDERITEGILTYRVWRKKLPIKIMSYFNFIWSIFKGFKYIISSGFKPDIIHAHIYEAGIPSVLIGKLYNIPVVITEHSSSFPRKLLSRFEVFEAKLAFRWANLVMPVSNALKKGIQNYGIKAHFCVIPNVVNTTLFYYSPRSKEARHLKRILFVGLLVPVKGLQYLFKALAQLRLETDDWHLDIVGDGPARKEYERLALILKIDEKIIFHGIKSKKEVAEFMRQADIFILPSLWENLPCVLIEAIASGLPIVSTLTGGIPEIIDDEVGVLVPPGNIEKLSDAIAFMIANINKFDRLKITQKAQRYSMEAVGKLLTKIYKSCLNNEPLY